MRKIFNLIVGMVFCVFPTVSSCEKFDLKLDNAATDLILPAAAKAIFEDISPNASDPSLVVRATALITGSWYEAAAPFHPTAVGVYSRLGRYNNTNPRNNNTDINTALLYSSRGILSYLFPTRVAEWNLMLTSVGLDPNYIDDNPSTAAGIGNAAAKAMILGRQNDGMNATGKYAGWDLNPRPFFDYTGYAPVNTAYLLSDPSRWQPDILLEKEGIYRVQSFVTPQYRYVEPFSYSAAKDFTFPRPEASDFSNTEKYTIQAQKVIDESTKLDDRKKMIAEFFDNKIFSLGFSTVFSAKSAELSVLDYVISDYFANMAVFDAGIVVWQEKEKYDAVRPFSAIRHLYKGQSVPTYSRSDQDTVQYIPGELWTSYLNVADHPEYPSASACLCSAHAEFKRRFFNSDELNWSVPVAAGSSRIEPLAVPKENITLDFPTWTSFANACAESRIWGGVHFEAAVKNSLSVCPIFGKYAYAYMNELLSGTAEQRSPSVGRFQEQ